MTIPIPQFTWLIDMTAIFNIIHYENSIEELAIQKRSLEIQEITLHIQGMQYGIILLESLIISCEKNKDNFQLYAYGNLAKLKNKTEYEESFQLRSSHFFPTWSTITVVFKVPVHQLIWL